MTILPSRTDYPTYQEWKSAYDSALAAQGTNATNVANGTTPQQLSPAQQRAKDIAAGNLSYDATIGQWKPRQGATVATTGQPVISKTFTNDLAYDETNPEDYLMQLSAKVQSSKKAPTQTELYNMYKAQNAMNKLQQTNNPMQAQLDAIQKQYDDARALETSGDNKAIEAYKAKLEQEYIQKIADAETQGKKQKEASQNVYSFSGFGRSTAAGDKATEIEQTTQRAISMLNAQKQLEIQLEEARLRGEDGEALKGLYASLEQTRKGVNDRQMESIKKTAEANQTVGASYIESINNFMKTAADSGIDIGDPKVVMQYAQMAKNPDGTINETFIKTLPEGVQAMIRSAAGAGLGNYEFIEATKTQGAGYFNKDTGKFIPLAQARSMGIGSGNGVGGYKPSETSNNLIGLLDDLSSDPNLSVAVGPGFTKIVNEKLYGDQYMGKAASFKAKRDTFVNQQVLPNLKLLKGTMSDKDVQFIQSASVPANLNMDEASFKKQLVNMRAILAGESYVNDSGIVVKGRRDGGTTTSNQYNENTTYKLGDTFIKDGKTYKVDKNLDYIEQ